MGTFDPRKQRLTTPILIDCGTTMTVGPNVPCLGVRLRAVCPGTIVYVGPPGVTVANGYPLAHGQELELAVKNLNQVAVIGTTVLNTTVVSEVGGYTGTANAGVTRNQPGALSDGNAAMQFDGVTGEVVIPPGGYSAQGTGPMTLEFWMKMSVQLTNLWPLNIKDSASAGIPGIGVQLTGASMAFILTDGTNANYNSVTVPYYNGQWHHFVAIVTRGAPDQFAVFFDGVLAHSQALPLSGFSLTNTQKAHLGAVVTGIGMTPCLLDEVAIYNVALTPAQIADHYARRQATMSYRNIVMADGPTGYWRLADPSGTVARDEVGANNGTISPTGVTTGVPGPVSGRAMAFDGVSGGVTTPIVLNTLAQFTMEIWVNPQAASSLFFATQSPTRLRLWSGGSWGFDAYISGIVQQIQGPSNVQFGQWVHLVGTYDGTTMRLYANASQIATGGPFSGPAAVTGPSFWIGRYASGAPYFFQGSLAEAAFYPVALTPAQIASHYAQQPMSYRDRVIADGASAYWRLGDTSGVGLQALPYFLD